MAFYIPFKGLGVVKINLKTAPLSLKVDLLLQLYCKNIF